MVIDGSQQAVDVVDVVDVDVVDVDVQMVGHQWLLIGPNRLSMLSMLLMLMLSMLMSKWLVINGY
jgi:hypothetical protein